MDIINWEFAPTGGGDVTGTNDPVTTTFKAVDISSNLARESIQNIIDAHDPNSRYPARAEFKLIERTADQLCLDNTLRKVLIGCENFNRKNKDAVEFYRNAIHKIQFKRFIRVLCIEDYNTVGLTGGDNDKDGNYFQLMKSVGGSSKTGKQGGSFGLGKGAYYAASSFHTIFVSSIYNNKEHVFQGKARLSSFQNDDTGEMMQGNGSYGKKGQAAIREYSLIPKIYGREETGTSFYIIGFIDESSEWQTEMLKSVINNFWYTISKGQLEVTVDGNTVNRDNLEFQMKRYFDESAPDKERVPNPWPYYLAYTSNDHIVYPGNLPELGEVKFYVLLRDNFPQKVSYIRQTGMIIQKKSIVSVNDYAGVFVCEDEKGNQILRKMENPAHDEWNKDNAAEHDNYERAKEVEKEIRSFISDSIKNLTSTNIPSSVRIGDLEDYLFLPGDEDTGSTSAGYTGLPLEKSSESETGNLIGRILESQPGLNTSVRKVNVIKETIITGIRGDDFPVIDGGKSHDGQIKAGSEGKGKEKIILLENVKFRTFANITPLGDTEHVIILKGPPGKKCFIELRAGTDDSLEAVNVTEVKTSDGSKLQTSGNVISGINIGINGSVRLRVRFDSEDKYSLNVTAYENK